ncbi:hypothetical protein B0T26DRAFT_726263 [Lasiosphaeria miniovina]|uniref:Uncharacterized protein n=1 Tax=Lasiosphaeria miniovina TaxID=1954250 RepID=A0AA40DMK4_9PEZI|nr:uncharacterized protein B0T26DRAFT_726263 [Lasiosphaeria miniovina]KAK0706342.1 hypothetical protein B0T26DRAFT_726263 [Lasiosphaeria miniovina]
MKIKMNIRPSLTLTHLTLSQRGEGDPHFSGLVSLFRFLTFVSIYPFLQNIWATTGTFPLVWQVHTLVVCILANLVFFSSFFQASTRDLAFWAGAFACVAL